MDFFEYYKKGNEPIKGDLLISEPSLPDPNFARTVVLLCEHNENGSFGFVLNKSGKLQLRDLMDEELVLDIDVYIGGPVQQNTLHFIHSQPELISGGVQLNGELYWGGDYDELVSKLKLNAIDTNKIKFFIGYSGWSEGQLLAELQQNSWIVSRGANIEQVFETDSTLLWKAALQNMGGKYKMFSNYPEDPRLN